MFIVYNHNDTELGEFKTLAEAEAEANEYSLQTGNPTFIEQA